MTGVYYVYMLRCIDGSLYTGITTDVQRRFSEHVSAGKKGAKYTRTHKPEKIAAVWRCSDRRSASRLEYRIKTLTKKQKEILAADGDLLIFADKLDIEGYVSERKEMLTLGENGKDI